jgi:hypothetical protein
MRRRVVAFVALAFCFVAGYFLASLWSSAREAAKEALVYSDAPTDSPRLWQVAPFA